MYERWKDAVFELRQMERKPVQATLTRRYSDVMLGYLFTRKLMRRSSII
jgi:hypothetical protein